MEWAIPGAHENARFHGLLAILQGATWHLNFKFQLLFLLTRVH